MNYSACFLGRPLPGTLRIASKADSGYIASFTNGSIPAVCRRLWAVLYDMPRASAISCIVNPFTVIHSLSAILAEKSRLAKRKFSELLCEIRCFVMRNCKKIEKFDIFAENFGKKVKKYGNIRYLLLTIMWKVSIIILLRQLKKP